jgi:general secretion pathway protein M
VKLGPINLSALNLRERLQSLEERERRLLGIAALIVGVGIVLVGPIALVAVAHGKRSDVEAVRAAITTIEDQSDAIQHAKLEKAALAERYKKPAPQLQAFLAKLASDVGVEIPESQDRQLVPRGKRFDERSTKVTLRKVGMLKLVKFLEKIELSGHPIKVSQIDIRKRADPDAYDVDLVVSAFDRKAPEPKPGAKNDKDGGAPESSSEAAPGAAPEEGASPKKEGEE